MPKKLRKDVLDFSKGIFATSIGAGVAGGIGSSLGGQAGAAATKGSIGLGKMAGYFPAIGSMMGGATVIRTLKKVNTKKRKRR